MRPGQARFITACQQLLVLGAVFAALTPAASVISLDVVGQVPLTDGARRPVPAGRASSAHLSAHLSARVPTAVVDPVVTEYALTPPAGARTVAGGLQARVTRAPEGATRLVGLPQDVSGYGAVGVSWAGLAPPEDELSVQVRTETGGAWSSWSTVPYEPEHGPDPGSREARGARPGTDPTLVGEVDRVQVRIDSAGAAPSDLRLAVIDPGTATSSRRESPAIDTATLDAPSTTTAGIPAAGEATKAPSTGEAADGLALQATTYTPKPKIFSRAQWGADESMRDRSSLHYFEVHAGFVHHTVNANGYTRSQVPSLLRGIYAYHVRVRGWSDIGYNFLVDRFGRIWEGRYGGVDRAVVGAHTLGYNDYSFAMSAIGNYETARPGDAVLKAYGRLFAWKLSLHGVDASSTRQQVGGRTFKAINGHRDAASTACPGRYLYAKLSVIRGYAKADQQSWAGRNRVTDLASSAFPDLVVRRASDDRVFVIPTGGTTRYGTATAIPALTTAALGATATRVVATPNVTGDDEGDLVVQDQTGRVSVLPGDGAGGFGAAVRRTQAFAGRDLITSAGDLDGDGRHDLVARNTTSDSLNVYRGRGGGAFTRVGIGGDWSRYQLLSGAGDLDGDGDADLVGKAGSTLYLLPGNGAGRFGAAVALPGDRSYVNALLGSGDLTRDGRPDLLVRDSRTGAGTILPARPGGSYGRPIGSVVRFKGLADLSAADLTGTVQVDAVARRHGAYLLMKHAGTFETGAPVATGMRLPRASMLLNVGDWDRDGFGDVVARTDGGGDLFLRRGNGRGRFGAPTQIGSGFAQVRLLAAVGDMTGDGYPDLMGQPRGGSMRIYPGAGLAGLRPSYVAFSGIDAGRQVGAGRWNGDGAPDSLLRKGRTLRLFPGNGPGGLVARATTFGVDLTPYDWVLGVGDAQRNGHADVVVREKSSGALYLLPGTTRGFGARILIGDGFGGYDLAG